MQFMHWFIGYTLQSLHHYMYYIRDTVDMLEYTCIGKEYLPVMTVKLSVKHK